ncbi:MAG: dihydrofolate reductase [Edaphocola sp.]
MKIRMVVAAAENNVIGIGDDLPWHLPDDLKFFKQKTTGLPVVMGKNTWRALGCKPLPNRLNVVASGSVTQMPEGVVLKKDLDEALAYLKAEGKSEIAVIGGGQIYHAALPLADTVYLTRVHAIVPKGTAFFPVLPADEWQLIWQEPHIADDRHQYAFTFQEWVRRK